MNYSRFDSNVQEGGSEENEKNSVRACENEITQGQGGSYLWSVNLILHIILPLIYLKTLRGKGKLIKLVWSRDRPRHCQCILCRVPQIRVYI